MSRDAVARHGPVDMQIHGMAQNILAQKILAWPGTEDVGTENDWRDLTHKTFGVLAN